MSVSRVYGVLVSRGQRGVFLPRLKYWTRGKYNQDEHFSLTLRHCSSKSNDRVNLGDVSKPIIEPQKIELVPIKYLSANKSQAILRHLRWMMQKDVLGQDMFLIGFPGPLRRQIAMMYLEMTKREVEYISLSRDTTESDLKQRREILAGTALYVDQCAVEAAVKGRVLVLEGIEKAERNVLPVLNNLLENREMQLDDGKFLVAASRYDQLLKDHTKEELDELNLVRVSENFRVIALGLPVPRYKGNPLDPPLRSRFQARGIQALPFKEHLEILEEAGKNIPSNRISQMLSFASTMLTDESASLGLPDFPIDNLHTAVTILNSNPNLSMQDALQRVYPYKMMLNKEGIKAVEDTMKKFELLSDKKKVFSATKVEKKDNMATVHLKSGTFSKCNLQVPAGNLDPAQLKSGNKFVKTAYHDNVIAEMFESHAAKDFCLIGPKGCGKSILVQNLADTLGYNIEPIHLHQDMTSRDLLQQRMTHPNGDTSWTPSPLVSAALNGNLAVLDGIHRINHGSFSVLHRLIHDRELHLYDGTRLLRQDRYAEIKDITGKTDEDLEESKIFPIHPSFRIIALAEPPVVGSSKQQWLTPEILTMFLYHNIRLLSLAEEEEVLKNLVPNCPDMTRLLDIVQKLRSSSDSTVLSLASSLSTRQLLRIARRQAIFPSEDLGSVIEKSCLARFLPKMARSALEQCLEESGVEKKTSNVVEDKETAITCEVKDGMVKIRDTSVPVFKPENLTKVPNILFYENPQHLAVMEDMLKDYSLGEHLLLVGNQGVGKNKIVDRFLQLLNRPREYLQLHRDTTVQTLTLQPTVQGGVITYEDSPLVRAVKEGNVLVIDEADKAPTQVTCILKTLVESGEMHMADGRRIVSANSALPPSPNVIVAHPDFRMIVLANRPGFPFLGNDFFAAMGDIFSCHAIDNPDADSEMAMLRQYGPDVPDATLKKLVMAFAELRDMADQGLIAYPYSTREVVNMVKHLQEFPLEGLTTIVRNVFDFDSYNNELRETIIDVMKKHGIPLGADHANVRLSKEFPLAEFQKVGHWKVAPLSSRKRGDMFSCPVLTGAINIKGPVQFPQENVTIDRHETRSSMFSELESQWLLPLDEGNVVADLAVTKNVNFPGQAKADMIHIATSNPIAVYSMSEKSVKAMFMDLYNLFPSVGMSYRPKVKLVPLLSPLDDTVILHEAHTNAIMSINYITGEVARLKSKFLPEVTVERRHFLRYGTKTKTEKDFEMLSSTIPGTNIVTLYEKDGDSVVLLDPLQGICHQITVPMNICNMALVDSNKWILTDSESNQKYTFTWSDAETFLLQPIHEENVAIENRINYASTRSLDDNTLNKALQQQISCPNRLLVTPKTDAVIILGYPELEYSTNEIYMIPRDGQSDDSPSYMPKPPKASADPVEPVVVLPESGQIVRAIETEKVPKSAQIARDDLLNASAFMEIIDMVNRKKRYIRVPSSGRAPPYAFWLVQPVKPTFFMAGLSNDGLVTVDSAGCVQLWETSLLHLERSLQEWRNMIGYEDTRPLQINYERESGKDVEGPKHGQIDPDNVPHVGGNTWAGGTGGRDTAGLGGFGGPYRLDAGHNVYQVPQHEKDAVPEEIKRAAREMAEKAFKERLREIQMSEYDAETYESFAKSVRRQIHSLRVIIDSLQAKGKERQWLKHQTYGDLDDTKLIEGITGEKTIYKRRGEQEPELGTPQELPKKLRLVVDVSGSMYRFNGHDGRLEREMSAVLMVMEALEGYENKFKYEIFGHSGESYDTNLVKADKVPKNNKERLTVLKTMHAHSQFCLSGDHTLEATKHSISSVLKEEADEYFVIILSDANFDRYGIRPQTFAKLLTENEEVNAFAIFIGSLGDQAVRLTKQLPMGRAFVCMDTDKLPQILQQIFTSTMLSSS